MVAPVVRSTSYATAQNVAANTSIGHTLPATIVDGDAIFMVVTWNGVGPRTVAANPPGYILQASGTNSVSTTNAGAIAVFSTIGSAAMANNYVACTLSGGSGAFGSVCGFLVVEGGGLNILGFSFVPNGTGTTTAFSCPQAGFDSPDHLAVSVICVDSPVNGTGGTAQVSLSSSDGTLVWGTGVPAGSNYPLGSGCSYHPTGMTTSWGASRTARGGLAGQFVIEGPPPNKTGNGGTIILLGKATAQRGSKKALNHWGTLTATGSATARAGVAHVASGHGTVTAKGSATARQGLFAPSFFGHGTVTAAANTTAHVGIAGGPNAHGTGKVIATGRAAAAAGLGAHTGHGTLSAEVEATGHGELYVQEGEGDGTPIEATVTLSGGGWAYDPLHPDKHYGQAPELIAVALVESHPGERIINYDVDLEPLSSTAAFTQKGVTIAAGQGLLPVGTVLALRESDNKYVVPVFEDTNHDAVLLRTAVDASTEDVLATVLISGVVRLDMLSTSDTAKLLPLGARISPGKGTARI